MPIFLAEERLGTRVAGRYRLDHIRRKGGMGVLYESFDEETSERVAVKMLKADYSLDALHVARFKRETRLAASLQHPNIATVLDVGNEGADTPFLVMELLDGQTLAELLEQRSRLSLEEALAIAIPIADALSAAHRAGIVHRDLKPSNIFLCGRSGGPFTPKLIDFGIAKGRLDDFETQSGMLLGTPGYMAPEQALHGECFSATDVWALGAVLYRALTGAAPHAGGSVTEMLARVVREPVPALVAPGVGRRAGATIDRALAMDPCQRYPDMATFADTLRASSAESTDDDPATLVEPAFDVLPPSVERAKAETPASAPRVRAFTAHRIGGAALGAALALIGVLALVPRSAPSVPSPDTVLRTAPREAREETAAATFTTGAVSVREPLAVAPVEPASASEARVKSKPRQATTSSERLRETAALRTRVANRPAEEQPANPDPPPVRAQPAAPERSREQVRDPGTGLSIATEW